MPITHGSTARENLLTWHVNETAIEMKQLLILVLLWSVIGWVAGYAQWRVEGKVEDGETGEPIGGATIFVNNTTYGTSSANNGSFVLKGLRMGTYEVVVSSLGYHTYVAQIDVRDTTMAYLHVGLRAQSTMLEEVEVVAFEPDGWARWGRVFLETFIGTSPNASNTRLLNPEALRFRHDPDNEYLEAVASEPLRIENRSLGYLVEYLLEDFRVDFRNGVNQYAGYPHFKKMEGRRRHQQAYTKRRAASYERSLMRFMRSLYQGTISEEGFEVRHMQRTPNLEKQRVAALQETLYTRVLDPKRQAYRNVLVNPDVYTDDSLAYFREVLNEEDVIDTIFPALLSSNDLVVDSMDGRKKLAFNDYLHVQNTRLKEEPGYLRSLHETRRPGPQQSLLSLHQVSYIWIERNGTYFPPQGLSMRWYWNWYDRVADLLPIDYDPIGDDEPRHENQ